MKRLPFVSIVVCCYNGADVLADCLHALQAQSYEGKLEIIVVNDGSSDTTLEVAQSFDGVKVITNQTNQGLAGSRNIGISAAKGSIVAFTDDDCRPASNWIAELVKAYDSEKTVAVGGAVVSNDDDTVTRRYLTESNPIAPLENTLAKSNKLTYRFGLYLKGLLGVGKPAAAPAPRRQVYSLVGANMSFRKKVLDEVQGFDARFRFGAEEEDLCKRIKERYPEGLLFTSEAKITHHFESGLKDTLRRSRAYGRGNARMVRKHPSMNPVVFPFPLLLAALLGLGFIHPLLLLVSPLLVPVVYARWMRFAVSRRRPEAVLYAYIQLLQEWYSNIGFAKGWREYRYMFKPAKARRPYGLVITPVVALFGMLLISQHVHLPWLAFAGALGMLLVPGHLIIRAMRLDVIRPVGYMALSTMLGIAWIMVWGLAAALLLPKLGIARPLDQQPFTIFYAAGLGVLAALALRNKYVPKTLTWWSWPRISYTSWLLFGLAAVLPYISFLGAEMLNAGMSNIVAIGGFVASGVVATIAVLRSKYLSPSVLPALLFSISLAAVWSYSLRGTYLFGWDIQQEFHVFQLTQQSGMWVAGAQHGAYDAMLSLTVLPTVLANVANAGGLLLFKVLFPVVFSFVPVFVFYAYNIFAKQWVAFTATLLTISQFYYMQQFSALVRQQVAFLFFSAMFFLLLTDGISRRAKQWLVGFAVFGLIVSHYSTTYMTVILLSLAYVVCRLLMLVRRDPLRRIIKSTGYLNVWLLAGLISGMVLWYGPVTHSSGPLKAAASNHDYAHIVQNADQKIQEHLQGNEKPVDTRAYLESIGKEYRQDRTYYSYYDDADNSKLDVRESPIIAKRAGFFQASQILDVTLRYGWWLLGLAAVAAFVFKVIEHFERQRLEIGLMAGAAITVFIAGHVVPGMSSFYNVSRINQQMLIFAALPAIMAMLWCLRNRSLLVRKVMITAAVLASFALASGVLTQFVGGSPSMNLNNSGSDYQRFYVQQTDYAAASWLGANRQPNVSVYADRYAALRLTVPAYIKSGLMDDVTPETLAKGAYVYADHTNIVDGVAMSGSQDGSYTYEFPKAFLKSHKNTIYSNGHAEIYR